MRIEATVMAVPIKIQVEFGKDASMEEIKEKIFQQAKDQLENNGLSLDIVDADIPDLIDGWDLDADRKIQTENLA